MTCRPLHLDVQEGWTITAADGLVSSKGFLTDQDSLPFFSVYFFLMYLLLVTWQDVFQKSKSNPQSSEHSSGNSDA